MKYTLLFIVSLLFSSSVFAQVGHPRCGSDAYLKQLDAAYPGLAAQVESYTTHGDYKTRATTVVIPVVFHVVYKSVAENLALTYLNAQIDLLNQCYARENSDTNNLRTIFKSRVGPSKIRFYIDQVIRVSTTSLFDASSISGFANSDVVKQTGSGGSDAVSPSTKLNIWICDLTMDGTDGLIGYAYPPIGAPNWSPGSGAPSPGFDGVVIDYLDVGGPNKQPLGYSSWGFRGKALVHEVAHYLGVRHIWGDDGGACQGQVGFKDDGISDTPVASEASNFDCNKTKNTCVETSGDLLDMVENYMDYSMESCQNSFTKLQVSAMEYVLDNIRTGVRLPVGINEVDDLAKQISMYPNPVSDVFYVDFNNLFIKPTGLSIQNALGQQVYASNELRLGSTFEVNTSSLGTGLFFVNILFEGGQRVTQKVMIR